jgi:hypothetical protein
MTSASDAYDAGPVLASYQGPRYNGRRTEFLLFEDRVLTISRWRGREWQGVSILNRMCAQPLGTLTRRGDVMQGLKKGALPGAIAAFVIAFASRFSPWAVLAAAAVALAVALPEIVGNFRPIRWVTFENLKDDSGLWIIEDPNRKSEFEAFVSAVRQQISRQPVLPAE